MDLKEPSERVLLKKGDAARELGVSAPRITQLLKRWPEVEDDRGLIDIERLKTLREKNADPLRQAVYQHQRKLKAAAEATASKPAAPTKSEAAATADSEPELPLELSDFQGARTRRERANAQLAELKAAQEAGRLIPRTEVQAYEFAVARKIRDRITGFPARLQQVLTPEATKMLTEECETILRELQQDVARIGSEDL